MYRAWQGGKREEAARLQAIAGELSGTLMLHTFPSIIKDAMQIAGLPAGHCRRPVSPAPAAVLKQLARVVTRLEQGNYLPGAAKITPA
jgi:4-hydroxy-tetrahydrodipicolinate synthase